MNNELSSWISVKSGVPQGSVLRSLLFRLFNDLPSIVSSPLMLFAYDSCLAIFEMLPQITYVYWPAIYMCLKLVAT